MVNKILTIDTYLAQFPSDVQAIIREMQAIIKRNASDVVESMSYGMLAYKTYHKPLVYVAGYKKHIGFYATPNTHEIFKDELKSYKHGKGSVQFSLAKPIPYDLITRIVLCRVKENKQKYDQ